MAIPSRVRAQASRIRKKGDAATPAEREWLRDYDERKRKPAAPRPVEPPRQNPPPARAPDSSASDAPSPDSSASDAPSTGAPTVLPSDDIPDGHVPISFDPAPGAVAGAHGGAPATAPAPPVAHGSTVAAPTCGDPACPACSKNVGGRICTATGKVVWDPIEAESAEGIAMVVMAGAAALAAFIREDGKKIPPSDRERAAMAKAIQKVTFRRFNQLGAIDDILLLTAAAGLYMTRATRAPAPAEAKDA